MAHGDITHIDIPVSDLVVVLGRGERLWDGLEGLEQRFEIEATSSPSGVLHLVFTRRSAR